MDHPQNYRLPPFDAATFSSQLQSLFAMFTSTATLNVVRKAKLWWSGSGQSGCMLTLLSDPISLTLFFWQGVLDCPEHTHNDKRLRRLYRADSAPYSAAIQAFDRSSR